MRKIDFVFIILSCLAFFVQIFTRNWSSKLNKEEQFDFWQQIEELYDLFSS
jgi:hypothetical protein